MAVGTTTSVKHTVKDTKPCGHHEEEGKTQAPHNPVLMEEPGATSSTKLDGNGLKVTIVASRWYQKEIYSLVEACSEELLDKGVAEDDLHLIKVTGAFELPYAAARIIHCKDASHRPDAVVCIGCIVKDGTHMCETMSHAVANGIMKLNVTSDVPVIFGVLCCDSEAQAHACTTECVSGGGGSGKKCNHGVSWAQSALEMAHLKHCAAVKKAEKCQCTRCTSRGGGPSVEEPKTESKTSGADQTAKSTAPDSATLCGGGCIAAAQRAADGECPACGCPADNCHCTKCQCPICGQSQSATLSTSCCGGVQAAAYATSGGCPACGCPKGNCPCTNCKCPVCGVK